MEPRTLDVPTPTGRLRLELRGRGVPALLLHGLSASRRTWDRVAPRLEGRLALLLPDLPGRGESEALPGLPLGPAEELAALRTALEAVPTPWPRVLIGHSQGAALALAWAAADRRVEGLLLLNPVHPWTRRPAALATLCLPIVRRALARLAPPLRRPLARRILARVYGERRRPADADVRRYAAPYRDPERVALLLELLADWDPAAVARSLPERPLSGRILAGGRDRRIGAEGPARLAARLGLPFETVRDAGHVLPEEAPALVAQAALDLAAELDADVRSAQPQYGRAVR